MNVLALLSLVSVLSLFLSYSSLSYFIPQIIALLSFLVIIISVKNKEKPLVSPTTLLLITTLISLLIFSTGALSSPFFFLLYFLLFFIAFLHPPPVTLAFTIIYILLLSPSLSSETSALSLLSLLLVTPASIFFSRQYLKLLSQQNKILILKNQLQKKSKSLEKTETDVLLWTSLNLNTALQNILDSLSFLSSQISSLKPTQKQEIKKNRKEIQKLLEQSHQFAHQIDKLTD